MTPNKMYLTKAYYIEGKRKIAVEFSNCEEKRTKSFPFFPSFFLGKAMPINALGSILSSYSAQKFIVKEKPHSFEVIASTLKDLKCLANLCLEAFGQRPILIEPERQFLISHDWSYFDSFYFFNDMPVKSNNEEFPIAKIDSLPESLHETARQLLSHDAAIAADFIKNIARAKMLRIPFEAPPINRFLELETILENISFSNGFGLAKEDGKGMGMELEFKRFYSDAIEMDFSELWPLLLTKPFYNLGFDSIDCSCCIPKSAFERNILPHSTVKAKALSEGFYFRSISQDYAAFFHKANVLKENRLRIKNEFYLSYLPIGPFRRNEEAELLVYDAIALSSNAKFEILGQGKLHWFCMEKESFLSKELRKLNKSIVSLSNEISLSQREAFHIHGLLAEKHLAQNLDLLFKKSLLELKREVCAFLVEHLANPKSRFFSSKLADAIKAVQALTMHRFAELLESQHGKLVHVGNAKAFVKTEQPMSLLKEFSQQQRIPQLIFAVKKSKTPNR